MSLDDFSKKKSEPARRVERPEHTDVRIDDRRRDDNRAAAAAAAIPQPDLLAEAAARRAALAAAKQAEEDAALMAKVAAESRELEDRRARMTPALFALIGPMSDAHKKTPPAARIEALTALGEIVDAPGFKEVEPIIVAELLPILLQRLDDKPAVRDLAAEVGKKIVAKVSVQGASIYNRHSPPTMLNVTNIHASVLACHPQSCRVTGAHSRTLHPHRHHLYHQSIVCLVNLYPQALTFA